jgi:hypothetical protein
MHYSVHIAVLLMIKQEGPERWLRDGNVELGISRR